MYAFNLHEQEFIRYINKLIIIVLAQTHSKIGRMRNLENGIESIKINVWDIIQMEVLTMSASM